MIRTPLSTVIGGAFWIPGATILGGTSKKTFDQIIKSLFANSEQGFVYDPNDLSMMFQDSAGIVPVTGAGQPVGLIFDKSKGSALGSEIVTNGDFNTGNLTGWANPDTAPSVTSVINNQVVMTAAVGNTLARLRQFKAVPIGTYEVSVQVVSLTWNITAHLSLGSGSSGDASYGVITLNQVGTIKRLVHVTTGSLGLAFAVSSVDGGTITINNVSVKQILGNHAYQTTSSMRPLLVASPQRLDYDIADDKLTTTLPAQLTGCTVIRSVPNVGTQILTNQTIPTTYNDNTDHCGLIVINRALTATETSQITKLFNRAAGV